MKTQHEKPSILWLCLDFFQLPIDLLVSEKNQKIIGNESFEDIKTPQAIYAISDKQQKIAFACPVALEAGIDIGMKLASVYVLQPDVIIKTRNERAEQNAMESLLSWAYHFSPTVSRYKNFCLLLEVGGCLKLFSGLSNLLSLVKDDLEGFGFAHRLGLGHTPQAAWLLSQYFLDLDGYSKDDWKKYDQEHFLLLLKKIPLSFLDVDKKQQQQLANLGLGTLGELLTLPRAEIGRRFGKDLVALLKKITGEDRDYRGDYQLADKYKIEQSFANGVDTLDSLRIPIRQMMAEFYQYLLFHQYHPNSFHWRFYYYGIPCDDIEITTSSLHGGMNAYIDLTLLKLENITLKAPVENLELVCDDFSPASQSSQELFPEISHPNNRLKDYQFLLDKLIQRMGECAVKTLVLNDEHLPEYKLQTKELDADTIRSIKVKYSKDISSINLDNHRQPNFPKPLWLMPTPDSIHEPATIAHSKPAFMKVVSSPQRLDSHWWRERSQRDYFIAHHKNGVYYWVFKDLKTKQWFVHGVYG